MAHSLYPHCHYVNCSNSGYPAVCLPYPHTGAERLRIDNSWQQFDVIIQQWAERYMDPLK